MFKLSIASVCLFLARETARIQAEDERVAQNLLLAKQRARESLESQIDLSQKEAEKAVIKERKIELYKDQVIIVYNMDF